METQEGFFHCLWICRGHRNANSECVVYLAPKNLKCHIGDLCEPPPILKGIYLSIAFKYLGNLSYLRLSGESVKYLWIFKSLSL